MVTHRSCDVLRASRYAFHGVRGLAVDFGDYQGDIVCIHSSVTCLHPVLFAILRL